MDHLHTVELQERESEYQNRLKDVPILKFRK